MNTRDEINKRTQLPKNDKPVEFVKKKKSKSEELLPRIRPRVTLPKNPQIFETIDYKSLPKSDSEDDLEIGDEITESILLAGGLKSNNGLIISNSSCTKKKLKQFQKNQDKNGKKSGEKKKRPQYARNVLMRGLMEEKMATMTINKNNSKFGDASNENFVSFRQAKKKRSL